MRDAATSSRTTTATTTSASGKFDLVLLGFGAVVWGGVRLTWNLACTAGDPRFGSSSIDSEEVSGRIYVMMGICTGEMHIIETTIPHDAGRIIIIVLVSGESKCHRNAAESVLHSSAAISTASAATTASTTTVTASES